jgi:hypothetical protein
MPRLVFILLTVIILTGCKEKKVTQKPQQESETKNDFFPVTQYLRGQLNELDSLPVTPLKITTIDGKTDSVWLKRNDISIFAQPFLTPVIDSATWSKYFAEISFLDQTINAFTFSYDAIERLPDSLALKRWDVYVNPETGKVMRVYIVKQYTNPRKTVQLTWKNDTYCRIATITETPGSTPHIRDEQVIWNFNE